MLFLKNFLLSFSDIFEKQFFINHTMILRLFILAVLISAKRNSIQEKQEYIPFPQLSESLGVLTSLLLLYFSNCFNISLFAISLLSFLYDRLILAKQHPFSYAFLCYAFSFLTTHLLVSCVDAVFCIVFRESFLIRNLFISTGICLFLGIFIFIFFIRKKYFYFYNKMPREIAIIAILNFTISLASSEGLIRIFRLFGIACSPANFLMIKLLESAIYYKLTKIICTRVFGSWFSVFHFTDRELV